MKSFNMLVSSPINGPASEDRYFIDGKRVSQAEFRKLADYAARRDTFHSYSFAGRWHNRSVIYV